MSIFDPIYRQEHVSGQITRKFFSIGQAIKHMLWQKSKLEKLTPAQIQILLYLNYARPDTTTVNALAKYLSCTPATVSGILDVLQNKKLIDRKKQNDDRRKVILALTEKGTAEVSALQDIGTDIEEMVKDFSETEQEVLQRLLVKMATQLAEKGMIVDPGICSKCCFFQRDKNPASEKPHQCNLLNILLSDSDIYKECPDYKDQIN